MRPEFMSLGDSREPNRTARADEALLDILARFDDSHPVALRDAYRMDTKNPWTEFASAVNCLVSAGFLMGKGDGFVVAHYFVTKKGRDLIGRKVLYGLRHADGAKNLEGLIAG